MILETGRKRQGSNKNIHLKSVHFVALLYINYSAANYRKRLDAHPNNLANALFQEQLGTRRLNP